MQHNISGMLTKIVLLPPTAPAYDSMDWYASKAPGNKVGDATFKSSYQIVAALPPRE